MFRTPAFLIAEGTSDAGSAADAAVEVELVAVVLFLLAQPVRASAVAIATMPAAWVRGRRRSGVTDPPGSGRRSGSQYGVPAPIRADSPVLSDRGSPSLRPIM